MLAILRFKPFGKSPLFSHIYSSSSAILTVQGLTRYYINILPLAELTSNYVTDGGKVSRSLDTFICFRPLLSAYIQRPKSILLPLKSFIQFVLSNRIQYLAPAQAISNILLPSRPVYHSGMHIYRECKFPLIIL